MNTPDYRTLALRPYAVPIKQEVLPEAKKKKRPHWTKNWPMQTLVFDCETTTDIVQKLKFLVYRVYEHKETLLDSELVEEGIAYAADLPEEELKVLADYCKEYYQDNDADRYLLHLRSKEDFLKHVFKRVAVTNGGAVVGFNLPFDFSRIAVDAKPARGRYKGGFSFVLSEYEDKKTGKMKANPHMPRIRIKAIDSKSSFISFSSNWRTKDERLTWANTDNPHPRGLFIDCRQFGYALTGRALSLVSACKEFGVQHGKIEGAEHGRVTPEYIDYARRDVLATWELYQRMLEQYASFGLGKPPNKLYSTASIGKAYLENMGLKMPELAVEPSLGLSPEAVLGMAMTTYYGGRSECRIRGEIVPVVYCDFLSMYPTVNTLMGLWKYLISQHVEVKDATAEVSRFLDAVTDDDLFQPETWQLLPAVIEIEPDDDILPVRADYGDREYQPFNIASNYLISAKPLWYTLADCIASRLLTGNAPRVRRALKFIPGPIQEGLKPITIPGGRTLNPKHEDFFREIIKERSRIRSLPQTADTKRDQYMLKILANSTSYGIFNQLNREDEKAKLQVYGLESFTCEAAYPESPGPYFFPVLASLITGAARLILAVAEKQVADLGGCYAVMDTDSLAIVASEPTCLIPCPGGTFSMPDGTPAIKALSWSEVDGIVDRFRNLNPYGSSESILKVEDENYRLNDAGGVDKNVREQLYCKAISVKRYCLFNWHGEDVIIRKPSYHGLGSYMVPRDPITGLYEKDQDAWIQRIWRRIIEGRGTDDLEPPWYQTPAKTMLSITNTETASWFAKYNAENPKKPKKLKPYSERVKPYNFMMHVQEATDWRDRFDSQSNPEGEPRERRLLVAPLEQPGPKQKGRPVLKDAQLWIDAHDPQGPFYRVYTSDGATRYTGCTASGEGTMLPVQSYRNLAVYYEHHPERKSLGPDGEVCGKRTRGVLLRRHITLSNLVYIGKEQNEFEEDQAMLHEDGDNHLITYLQDMAPVIAAVLRDIPVAELKEKTGYSDRQLSRFRSGKQEIMGEQAEQLVELALQFARARLTDAGLEELPGCKSEVFSLYRMYLSRSPRRGRPSISTVEVQLADA